MEKIVILGAGGFVGRNLTAYFQDKTDKYKVTPVTRKQINLLDTEKVWDFFTKNHFDTVIHCANQGGSRKTAYDMQSVDVVGNNLRMFFNIEKCLPKETKFINFGSGAQYDKQRELKKISESEMGQFIPRDDYGFSKYVMSRYMGEKARENSYNPVIFGLYGWKEDYSFKFISNAIIKNLLHMPLVINQNVVFDYLFIEDFFRIIERNIDSDFSNKEYNITPTDSIDLKKICEIINQYSEFQSEIIIKNEGYNFTYTADNQLLLENVGTDFSFTSYEKGIYKLMEYYKEHFRELDLSGVRQDKALQYCKIRSD